MAVWSTYSRAKQKRTELFTQFIHEMQDTKNPLAIKIQVEQGEKVAPKTLGSCHTKWMSRSRSTSLRRTQTGKEKKRRRWNWRVWWKFGWLQIADKLSLQEVFWRIVERPLRMKMWRRWGRRPGGSMSGKPRIFDIVGVLYLPSVSCLRYTTNKRRILFHKGLAGCWYWWSRSNVAIWILYRSSTFVSILSCMPQKWSSWGSRMGFVPHFIKRMTAETLTGRQSLTPNLGEEEDRVMHTNSKQSGYESALVDARYPWCDSKGG